MPTAFVRFLETDSRTKQLAKPQLRGAEGQELTLNLGDQIPVVSTVFGAAAAGGFANIPQSSFTYRDVGVNITMTPRVTYEGEIILDLSVESSNLGGEHQRRRPGRAVVRIAPREDAAAAARRASRTCSPGC